MRENTKKSRHSATPAPHFAHFAPKCTAGQRPAGRRAKAKTSFCGSYGINKVLITGGRVILYVKSRDFVKKLCATVYLGIFYPVELHGLQRTFCLGDEENVFDFAFPHRYRTVGSIVAYRRGDLERARQFRIYHDRLRFVKVVGKVALTLAVGDNVVRYMLRSLNRFVEFCTARGGEYVGVIFAIGEVIVCSLTLV